MAINKLRKTELGKVGGPLRGGTGFQPVDPVKAHSSTYHKRYLPHFEVSFATYFVTFHCVRPLKMDDQAMGIAFEASKYWNGTRLELDASVVMLDHVHMIFRITDDSSLSEILHSIKSFSSNRINKVLGRDGVFWQDENFDHVIRNEDQWHQKIEYVRNNPVKKGFADTPEDYPFLYVRNV